MRYPTEQRQARRRARHSRVSVRQHRAIQSEPECRVLPEARRAAHPLRRPAFQPELPSPVARAQDERSAPRASAIRLPAAEGGATDRGRPPLASRLWSGPDKRTVERTTGRTGARCDAFEEKEWASCWSVRALQATVNVVGVDELFARRDGVIGTDGPPRRAELLDVRCKNPRPDVGVHAGIE